MGITFLSYLREGWYAAYHMQENQNHLQVLTVFNFWTMKYFLQRISYDTITIKYVNHDSFNQCFVVSSFELSIEVQPLNDFTHFNHHTVLHTVIHCNLNYYENVFVNSHHNINIIYIIEYTDR